MTRAAFAEQVFRELFAGARQRVQEAIESGNDAAVEAARAAYEDLCTDYEQFEQPADDGVRA